MQTEERVASIEERRGSIPGLSRQALKSDLLGSAGDHRFLGRLVGDDARDEVVLALGRRHVLHAHVQVLVDDASVHVFAEAHADSAARHVVDYARAAVVVLEGHALHHGRVTLDVDVVSHFVSGQVRRQLDHAALSEGARKHVARPRAVSKGVRHLETSGCLRKITTGPPK